MLSHQLAYMIVGLGSAGSELLGKHCTRNAAVKQADNLTHSYRCPESFGIFNFSGNIGSTSTLLMIFACRCTLQNLAEGGLQRVNEPQILGQNCNIKEDADSEGPAHAQDDVPVSAMALAERLALACALRILHIDISSGC